MEEIWKPFIKNDNEYEASNLGHFRRTLKGKTYPLKVSLSGSGVPRVRVYNSYVNAANAVAKAFLPDPGYVGTAVPKDCNPANLCAENLKWIPGFVNVFSYCMDGKLKMMESLIAKEWSYD